VARNPQDFDHDPVETDSGQGRLTLLQVVWNRKALVLLGVVVGLALGTLNYLRKQPVYQSTAQLLVINKRPVPIMGLDAQLAAAGYAEDFASAHLSIIKSTLVLGKAAKKLADSDLKTFQGHDPVGVLSEGVAVVRDKKDAASYNTTNAVLNLSFSGPATEECPIILQGVIDSYADFLQSTYQADRESRMIQLTTIRDKMIKELQKERQEYRKFREEAQIIFKGKDGGTIQQEGLAAIEAERSRLKTRIVELQARYDTIKKAVAEKRDPTALMELSFDPGKPPAVDPVVDQSRSALNAVLLPLMLEEQKLREGPLGKDHPEVVSIRNKIKLIRDYFNQEQSDLGKPVAAPDKPTVENYLERLANQIEDARRTEAALKGLFDEEHQLVKKLVPLELEDHERRQTISSLEAYLEGINKTIPEIAGEKETEKERQGKNNFGGFETKTLIPPGGAAKVEPKPVSSFGIALFLGLVLGLGLAWLAEVSDKSFRTPEEIRRRLGLPIVGHIPFLKPDEESAEKARAAGVAMDPLLCTYHKSKSVQAEAYRGVRTALYFSTQGQKHQVIQVTSPNKGDGKSTVTANLAVSIAQSGKKVLVVDADFRRPRQHKVFGLAGRVGVASVMAGEAELEAAVQPTVVDNLSVLPCGPRPANPAELLTSPRFAELLETLRGRYDFVIVDTPPLLAVSDPSVVAPRVDGVLLTIRVSKNGRPHAERAREILTGLGAKIVGVVVNGVGRWRDGYENAQYTYGYGYGSGYHYGYAYTYEPEDAKSYYEETESGVNLSGTGRNGNGSAAAANTQPGSNSEIDLGALPVRNGPEGESPSHARRHARSAPRPRGASRRKPSRAGLMGWLRGLWS
jgi:capsular exopolysaccharide synthesis family protein